MRTVLCGALLYLVFKKKPKTKWITRSNYITSATIIIYQLEIEMMSFHIIPRIIRNKKPELAHSASWLDKYPDPCIIEIFEV